MTKNAALVGWASLPVLAWGIQITLGLVASRVVCDSIVVLNLLGAVFLTISAVGLLKSNAIRTKVRDGSGEVAGFLSNAAVLVAFLFTLGVAMSWAMVAAGVCL